MSGTVLVLGGRSEIGTAVAVRLARGGAKRFVLAARPGADLSEQTAALREAGAETVATEDFDADDLSAHRPLLDRVLEEHGPLETVVLAFGILGDQARAEADAAHATAIVHTDYVAQVSVLTHAAELLRAQGSGNLVVFSSVAGIRVRRANYVYGSAKAGLDGFASGLSDALHGTGVHLLLVRPGFVIGRMTEGMSPAPFSSTADQVAGAAVAALRRRREVVWVPGVLRLVFAATRFVPRAVWRRMPR
ncbi:SDR family NAD(P)-dependent oxidoreductase [Amycolatopsis rubida]|uniref:SDR family NAD(P)-dependent oxidoreductase n=1 Tax=Amycolatopsis rubida TaxID=112413 RepID=A0ABX0BKH0_9PSEU|nr:SDR family NAD(P)-dependent oxidoreductase [Amycolatopsis sp. M39]MYW90276.1 SDR family NAD(P)-dependent oxidoreductase [Amycolatopsis rubida]NEC55253.1 SDR family NAD(P)-dependent oxidoreductase [Amycolatopsis rubida]